MALQRLRNDPEAGWELRKLTPLWSPDFLMMSPDCILCSGKVKMMNKVDTYLETRSNTHLAVVR